MEVHMLCSCLACSALSALSVPRPARVINWSQLFAAIECRVVVRRASRWSSRPVGGV
jgi:hypothetical protein